MKIAFSTIGCPNWSEGEIFSVAKDCGYDGVELRVISNHIHLPAYKEFSKNHINATKEKIKKLNLEIPCLTTAVELHNIDYDYKKELNEYITLAKELDVPYIRVLGETKPAPTEGIDIDLVAGRLSEIGKLANENGVMLLIETNGIFANSDTMLKLLELSGTTGIGVLWDIHHPYRFYKENPNDTFAKLKTHIKHIHIKD